MYYSSIGVLAVLVLLIINQEILFHPDSSHPFPGQKAYRKFLIGVFAYYITDILWGILDETHLIRLLYADTVLYFLVRAVSILLWTQYVSAYLEEKNVLTMGLKYIGILYMIFEITVGAVNLFTPILFTIDASGKYISGPVRHIALYIQILMFLMTSLAAFYMMFGEDAVNRDRHRTIALSGLAMVFLIIIQLFDPLLPMYTIGYLLGTCLMHTFVIEDERKSQWRELQETLSREKKQLAQIASARHLAYTDALTGVKSKLAWVDAESLADQQIAEGTAGEMAVAVFDLNDLKKVNDTGGHDAGDRYILESCREICHQFRHSPVFRIGGDEFAAILSGEDYAGRKQLARDFSDRMEFRIRDGNGRAVAMGMTDYLPGVDNSFRSVFERADRAMYAAKQRMKSRGNG